MMDHKLFRSLKGLEQMNAPIEDSRRFRPKALSGTVCKYWLENKCKKGDNCEYIHEYIKDKLPECPSLQMNGKCLRGTDCPFKHSEKQIRECHFYMNGYCKDGINCKLAHINKELCYNYLLGFCPKGPQCEFYHLKSLIHPLQDNLNYLTKKTVFDTSNFMMS